MPSGSFLPSRRGVRTGILRAGALLAAFLLAFLFARNELATIFRYYDDEGYMLQSFAHYFAGGHLYTEVFSEYDPFNFIAERALFQLLHLPVNHDAGRLVTLIWWLLSAVLAGVFTYRLPRNTHLASAAGLATMALGRALANEPGHPNQLVLPLLMLACCASVTRRRMSLLLLGLFGAALFFTKIWRIGMVTRLGNYRQEQILHILESNPRSCVAYNEELVHFWGSTDQELDQLPLAHYILFDMRKVDQEGGYSIFVEPQRGSPWVEVRAYKSP